MVFLQKQINETPQYLVVQRPETGLLANMWEFPSVDVMTVEDEAELTVAPFEARKETMNNFLTSELGFRAADLKLVRQNPFPNLRLRSCFLIRTL